MRSARVLSHSGSHQPSGDGSAQKYSSYLVPNLSDVVTHQPNCLFFPPITCHFISWKVDREADVPGQQFPFPALANHFLPCFSLNEISDINISEVNGWCLPRDWARPKHLILLSNS